MLKEEQVHRLGDLWLSGVAVCRFEGKVKAYMAGVFPDHVDPHTDELNTTMLAEGAAMKFDLYYGEDYEIPQDLFDWAIEVWENHE